MNPDKDTTIELRPRRHHKDDAELDITPMIDITFLLLAFFVVVSKMDPTTAIEMPRAQYGVAIPDRSAVILAVTESSSDIPNVFKGKSTDQAFRIRGDIAEIEEQVTDYVAEQLRNDQAKTAVIIKAERKVKTRHIEIVKRAVSRALETQEGQLIYIGVEEQ